MIIPHVISEVKSALPMGSIIDAGCSCIGRVHRMYLWLLPLLNERFRKMPSLLRTGKANESFKYNLYILF